jgi:hypothetical protein
VEISGSGRQNLTYARHGKRSATDGFRVEVDFEQVLYRLALHAQSLFTAAACFGRCDELVLPGGDSAADLGSFLYRQSAILERDSGVELSRASRLVVTYLCDAQLVSMVSSEDTGENDT